MAWKNDTIIKEFILLGLSSNPNIQTMLFVIVLIMYLIILIANSLIILATITDSTLHTPMYFFLTYLSILDICYSSSLIPRMLRDMLSVKKNILVGECGTQMYMALSLGETECILLAIMAYDRYIAICYPLHYSTIINISLCIKIAAGALICAFLLSSVSVSLALNGDLCGNNVINHFLCELPGVLSLGCGNAKIVELVIFINGIIVLIAPISFIIITYIKILRAIFRISFSAGQRKAFSTCGSHITVVTMFYGSAMATYMKFQFEVSPEIIKLFAVFYAIIIPMLNPLIYTLRNKEVKSALKKVLCNCV
ncbi:putative olfactory receptor 2B8 [Aquarana catesbeiana]|uniref:putative olfactory receptor 2B8 n=1 Tax=Aquarana catesbeiana TaxID=8400 RepID=UPI003CC98984